MQGSSEDIISLFLVSSLIILLVIAGVAIFMVAYQRRVVRQKLLLQEQEIAHQQRVMHATVDTQERERQRIGKDLHDEVGAMLSAVKMNLTLLDRQVKKLTEAPPSFGDAKNMLDDAIGNVRRISHDLLPPGLEKLGLVPALDSFREKVARLSGIDYTLVTEGEVWRLPSATELAAYRVVQELTSNSLKHGSPSAIQILIQFSPTEVKIIYQDDGVGFSMQDPEGGATKPKGLGLLNLQNRIEMTGGQFDMESAPGKGMKASIQLYSEQSSTVNA